MYISEFVCGIIATLITEIAVLIILTLRKEG